jgi:hypothetical protein
MSPWVLSSIHIQQLELCSCARLLPQVSGYISWTQSVHWRYAPLPDYYVLPQVSEHISWTQPDHCRFAPLPDHCHRSEGTFLDTAIPLEICSSARLLPQVSGYISGHSHSIRDMLLCQTTATGQWVHFLDTVTPRETCFTTAIGQLCTGLHGGHALVPSPEKLYRQLAKYTVTLLTQCMYSMVSHLCSPLACRSLQDE